MNSKDILRFYKGLTEYIIEHSAPREQDRTYAGSLKAELRECIKNDKPLGTWWGLLAYDLFSRRNIEDDRIVKPEAISEVKFSYNGNDYTVAVTYADFDVRGFSATATLTLNSLREDEVKYIEKVMKRHIDRNPLLDKTRVEIYKNYVLLFDKDEEE